MGKSEIQNSTTEVPTAGTSTRPVPHLAELHVVWPADVAASLLLQAPRVTLGRQPDDGTPPILHKLVSRRHFAITWDPARHVHTGVDLGSSNGSTVDGLPATAEVALRDGSLIRIGPVLLVYELKQALPAPDPAQVSHDAIPGRSAAARALRARVAQVAADPSPVLLSGETGTGKEFVAREIHRLSGRRGPFVAINCAALAPQLLESELFGHVRGAFSGALSDQPGVFRAAHGGTLLLDELGELAPALQPKLLRALQEQAVRPVGATRDVKVDVRVIAATNRDLAAMVEREEFRRDLFARLSLWEIAMPPLRARKADLFAWIERLYARFRAGRGLPAAPPPELDPDAAEALLRCDFPDNLRGIDRLVHALAELADRPERAPLTTAELPAWLWSRASERVAPPSNAPDAASASAKPPKPPIPSREELAAVLAQNGGSIRATARHFGRDRKQIYRWIETYGLEGK